MIRAKNNQSLGNWIIEKSGKYLAGECLSEGIKPVYTEDIMKAVRYKDKDIAELVQSRYGGRVVSVQPAIAQAV